jgi:hypothetical protein
MQPIMQMLAILISLVILFGTLELVRNGKLRSEYSILWLMSAFLLLIMSVFKGTLDTVADFLGVGYAPSLLFMAALICVVIIQIAQNIVMSNQSSKSRDLAQELSILQWRIREVEKKEELNRFMQIGVHMIIARLTATTGWDQLVNQMLEKVMQLVCADTASLVLLDEEHGDLYIEAATHLSPDIVSQTRVKLGEGVTGWVAQQREALLLNGQIDAGCFLNFIPKPTMVSSSISVPLIAPVSSRPFALVFGVLNISRRRNAPLFTANELGLVVELSVQVAPLLHNAKLSKPFPQHENWGDVLPDPALDVILPKGDSTSHEATQTTGNWIGRSHLRLDETVGAAGLAANVAETHDGRDSRGTS